MADIERGRIGALFILFFSLFVLFLVLCYLYYLANSSKGGTIQDNPSPAEISPNSPNSNDNSKEAVDSSLLPVVQRIRRSLLKYLPNGTETPKFRQTFDELEKAALFGRIDQQKIASFNTAVKTALADGSIDDSEMDNLLDLLESAIIK